MLWLLEGECGEKGRIEGKKGEAKTYMFNESTLVLECVTLTQMVELVVEVLVDLPRRAIFDQKAAEDAEAAHPDDLAVFVLYISIHLAYSMIYVAL